MRIFFCVINFCFFSLYAFTQTDTLLIKLDSLHKKTDSAGGQTNIIHPQSYTQHTTITFSNYFVLLGSDIKQDVTSPFHLTNKQLLHTGIYVGAFIALQSCSEYFDEPVQRFAVRMNNSSNTVSSISNHITKFGGRYEIYSLAALGGYGFVFSNKKMQTTTLLATQAYLTAGLMENIVKSITGRQRPSYYNPDHLESEPTFHGPFYKKGVDISGQSVNSSFPSGHTTVIFAAATVFAKEYKNTPWVPVTAYSAASLVGLSRLTENKHWATDIIAGATLGFLCGNQVVNNYHRYAKIKAPNKSGTLSFNLNYNGNNFEPGLIYTFRK